jgi:hypothetical protein
MRRILILLLAAASLIAACGGDPEPVTFGEGEIPESVPDDFPIPPGAAIGSTMVDRVNNRTEFAILVRTDLETLVQFYTVELVGAGYIVETSEGGGVGLWEISFDRGDLQGTITMTSPAIGVSQAVVSINRS